jgi:steroid 5-alpha reductase family enzyme
METTQTHTLNASKATALRADADYRWSNIAQMLEAGKTAEHAKFIIFEASQALFSLSIAETLEQAS